MNKIEFFDAFPALYKDEKTGLIWPSWGPTSEFTLAIKQIYEIVNICNKEIELKKTQVFDCEKNFSPSWRVAEEIMEYVKSQFIFIINNYPRNFPNCDIKFNEETSDWYDNKTGEVIYPSKFKSWSRELQSP